MKNIVIIGAGPAGLTAAYELLSSEKGYHVTILEESDQIGGISRTINHNGNRMDIGGHRFFSKDPRINAWWNQFMPMQGEPAMDDMKTKRNVRLMPGGPDPQTQDAVMLNRRRVSRIYYNHRFFDYPVKLNAQTLRSMGLVSSAQAGCSYLHACVRKKDETSLENFYINRFGRKLYSMFFEAYTEKLWGRKPADISAEWGAQRVKGLSVKEVCRDMAQRMKPGGRREDADVETSLIESFSYPKYGPGQLWEAIANEIRRMGGVIHMNCRVTGLTIHDTHIDGITYETLGIKHHMRADIVISSMPLKDLVAGIHHAPSHIKRIAEGLPYRDFVTTGVLVRRLSLKNKTKLKTLSNIIPDCWIYVQDKLVKMGRIQIFNNWSPYMVSNPEETVWIGTEYFVSEGDEMWNMTDSQWTHFVGEELVKMGVIAEDKEIIDTHVERVKKAYPAYFDTYAQIDQLRAYLDTFDNLYCIGRNGQHRYNNMDHSMATAFEAVRCIRENIRDRSALWNVNTEQTYHEERKAG